MAYESSRPGDIRDSVGNPQKARDELGLTAETSLEAGLSYYLTSLGEFPAGSNAPTA